MQGRPNSNWYASVEKYWVTKRPEMEKVVPRPNNPRKFVIYWADCIGVTVDGGEIAKSRVAATVMFGVWGLGAQDKETLTFLSIYRKDGAVACYRIPGTDPQGLRVRLRPLLLKVGVPFLDEPAAVQVTPPAHTSPPSVADELAKLAALRDSGVISNEEFAAQKAKLLG